MEIKKTKIVVALYLLFIFLSLRVTGQENEVNWYFPYPEGCADTISGDLDKIQKLRLKTYWYEVAKLPLDKLRNLEYLSISNCRVDDIRLFMKKVSKLPKLEYLDIDGNRIDSVYFMRESFPALKYFSIANSFVEYIDSSIAELKQLEYLNLGLIGSTGHYGNSIETLPNSMEKLTRLETLVYIRNGLDSLPSVISNIVSLKYLNVSSNNLRRLPDEIANLVNLRVLNISYNKFGKKPRVLDKMKNTKVIM